MFSMKIEALGGFCENGICISLKHASVGKMMEQHSKLCQSHEECKTKGSGNFCAHFNPRVDYGLCFHT